MSNATKRTVLRCSHLIFSIPMLGYVYGKQADVAQYAGAARFMFVPLVILTGLWMYGGLVFAVIGAGLWLGASYFVGYGTALLSQIVLFAVRKIWLMSRKRRTVVQAGVAS